LREDGGGPSGDGVDHRRAVGQDNGDGQRVGVDDVQQAGRPHVHVGGAQRAWRKLRSQHGRAVRRFLGFGCRAAPSCWIALRAGHAPLQQP